MGRGHTVWVLDDDDGSRKTLSKLIGSFDTTGMVIADGDLTDLMVNAPLVAADFIVIDLSALSTHPYEPRMFYGPICKLCELHPGAVIVILSAVSRYIADDTVEMVREHVDNVVKVLDSAAPSAMNQLEKLMAQ